MKYGVSVRLARSTGFALEADASFPDKGIRAGSSSPAKPGRTTKRESFFPRTTARWDTSFRRRVFFRT